jgi:hypothetical protein
MQASISSGVVSSFSMLFARYVNGQINENAFKKMMHTFDSARINRTERLAFARFMNDMISEGRGGLNVPRPEEAEDILTDMRVPRT